METTTLRTELFSVTKPATNKNDINNYCHSRPKLDFAQLLLLSILLSLNLNKFETIHVKQ